eukprot:513196-Pyramimonas_sp.AAC.1
MFVYLGGPRGPQRAPKAELLPLPQGRLRAHREGRARGGLQQRRGLGPGGGGGAELNSAQERANAVAAAVEAL